MGFQDDFGGRCGAGRFPLLASLNKELEGYKVTLEYDGPYESYNPRGQYTTKDRTFINSFNKICLKIITIISFQLMKSLALRKMDILVIMLIEPIALIIGCVKVNIYF